MKLIVICSAIALMIVSSMQGRADIFTATEPPIAGLLDGRYQYPDGSPESQRYQYPAEIYNMSLETLGGGTVKFEIQTNFGDPASRQAYDLAHPTWRWMDSYTGPWGQGNIAAGDLYIRIHTPQTDISADRVFGLVLESRTGTTSDLWYDTMKGAKYTTGSNPYDVTKTAGQLWKLTGNAGFATGTYEGYEAAFNNELPQMTDARLLPGLENNGDPRDTLNSYPTLLLGGTLATTSGNWAQWDPDQYSAGAYGYKGGVWEGQFTLPSTDLNRGDLVEVWWSMQCGNDAVMVGGVTGADVPTPSSLLLCVIGVGFAAVSLRLRRHA